MSWRVSEFPSFSRRNNSSVVCSHICLATRLIVYPLICGWTCGLLPPLGHCEKCSYEHICTDIFAPPCFQFLWVCSRSGSAGSYDIPIPNFRRNCRTVFHRVCAPGRHFHSFYDALGRKLSSYRRQLRERIAWPRLHIVNYHACLEHD